MVGIALCKDDYDDDVNGMSDKDARVAFNEARELITMSNDDLQARMRADD